MNSSHHLTSLNIQNNQPQVNELSAQRARLVQQLQVMKQQEAMFEQQRQAAAERDPIKEEQKRLMAIQKQAERRRASPLLAMTDDLMNRFKQFDMQRQQMMAKMQNCQMEGQKIQMQAQQLGMPPGQWSAPLMQKYSHFQNRHNRAEAELTKNIMPKWKVIRARLTFAQKFQTLQGKLFQLKQHVMQHQGGQGTPQQIQMSQQMQQEIFQCMQVLKPAIEEWQMAQRKAE